MATIYKDFEDFKVGMKMDTSEKYIKMCESAKDIQRFWNFENGDYVFDRYDEETMVWFGYPPEE